MKKCSAGNLQFIEGKLIQAQANIVHMPGIANPVFRRVFAQQLVDSFRRIDFFNVIQSRPISSSRIDPNSSVFDPLRGAIYERNNGRVDNGIWLAFLATHYGKHDDVGWKACREVYAGNKNQIWQWNNVLHNRQGFEAWLNQYYLQKIHQNRYLPFSNHRKYQSHKNTAKVTKSFIDWMQQRGQISGLIKFANQKVGQNPHELFDFIYEDMSQVKQFARLGKFDFLTTIGKLNLAPITPGRAYFKGSTGPIAGARLLFDNDRDSASSHAVLEAKTSQLATLFNEPFIKQVLEDAMCNWQKNPDIYVMFR